MTTRNATLFFVIAAILIGGGAWFFIGGKSSPKQNIAENLPPPTVPTDNTATDQNQQPKESWFSKLFSMPSFGDSASNFLPSLPATQEPSGYDSTDANTSTNAGTETSPETNTNSSPLKGKISFSYDRSTYYGAGEKDYANQEYLSVKTEQNITDKIRITGLVIKSAASNTKVIIGQGVYLYFSGTINSPQDIYLGPNETAHIITGRSPLGVSFRVNKCLGYLSQNQNFTPYLYSNCPAIQDEPMPQAPNQLNDKCLDYIQYFPSCTTFTTGKLELSPECNNFLIEKANYSYCSRAHKNDKDFYSADWRIYLSRDETIWKDKRETIELLDQNGKLIDSISY
ncbi:MAG: hypothetical protein WC673_03400 [Candidatus Paceibacterota bacterium]|jgi:hypothetical protein